jgi:basic membrane protein A
MNNGLIAWMILSLLCSHLFTGCKKDAGTLPLRVGLVTGIGTLNDRGFNQQAYEGVVAASGIVNLEYEVRESSSAADIVSNIRYLVNKKVDLIITLGFDAAQPSLDAALANPSVKFLLLDYSFSSLPLNIACVQFRVDQASFPCGFLAAYLAFLKNPGNPIAGFVAGPDIPPIQQFAMSYVSGVRYFNDKYNRKVMVTGNSVSSFTDTLRGAQVADSLISVGAEVIFAFAGKSGNGALYKVKEKGKAAIGVDTDQFLTIPDIGNILITSCMKRLDTAIKSEILLISGGQFHGGQTITLSLKDKGVDLAPYHAFDPLLPDSIKQAVLDIKLGIANGTIATGWH